MKVAYVIFGTVKNPSKMSDMGEQFHVSKEMDQITTVSYLFKF